MASSKSPTSSPSRGSQQTPGNVKPLSPSRDATTTNSSKTVAPLTQDNAKTMLTAPFPQFCHQDVIVKPFDDELRRDMLFQEQLHQLLLKLFIDFHAWSTSRPEFESTSTGNTLFEETQAILTREKEQGMWSFLLESSRTRLLEFITRIKDALAVLTGLGL